jgi:WASH complex subunit 7
VFALLKTNFSEKSDYLRMLVKVFEKVRGGENKHLKLFHYIIPALTINFVENMLIAKERLNKKNSSECFISVANPSQSLRTMGSSSESSTS